MALEIIEKARLLLEETSSDVFSSDIRFGSHLFSINRREGNSDDKSLLTLIRGGVFANSVNDLVDICRKLLDQPTPLSEVADICRYLCASTRHPLRDKDVLVSRYATFDLGLMNMAQISASLNISRQRITQIIQAAQLKAMSCSIASPVLLKKVKQLSLDPVKTPEFECLSTFAYHFISPERHKKNHLISEGLFFFIAKACNEMASQVGAVHAPTISSYVMEKKRLIITSSQVTDVASRLPGFYWLNKKNKWFFLPSNENHILDTAKKTEKDDLVNFDCIYSKYSQSFDSANEESSFSMVAPVDVVVAVLQGMKTNNAYHR